MTAVGLELYEALGPHYESDQGMPGQPLAVLADAAIMGMQSIEDVIRDTDTHVGWGVIMDPDDAPEDWLEWLSQFGGGPVPPGATEAQKRQHIKDAPAFRRGSKSAMIGSIKPNLAAPQTVYFKERDGGAYLLTVAVVNSQIITSTAEVLKSALKQKPGGIKMTLLFVSGGDYATVTASKATYASMLPIYSTYADVLLNPGAT